MKNPPKKIVCKKAIRNLVFRMDKGHLRDKCLKSGICPNCGNEDLKVKVYGQYNQYSDYECAICKLNIEKSMITGILGLTKQ